MDTILYHFTKPEYLYSILASGLIPGHKSGMARGYNWSCVFLTDDPDYIMKYQCGKDWPRVLLKINCAGLDVVPHLLWKGSDIPSPHEFTYSGTIVPQRIKCVSTY